MSGVNLGDGGAESCFGSFGTGPKTNFLEFEFVQCEIKEARDVEALDSLLRASPKCVNVNLACSSETAGSPRSQTVLLHPERLNPSILDRAVSPVRPLTV